MKRYLDLPVRRDIRQKMVLLSGPRQVGKTFMAQTVMNDFQRPQYLNFDHSEDARIIMGRTWREDADLLILDEIHKLKDWKRFLKGTFDVRPSGQAILVTGSARLDTFRQSGASLAGRYFPFHLYPLSVKELADQIPPAESLPLLNRLGGFPEPFLSGSEMQAVRWRNQYYTDLIREDILEFSRIQEIRAMRLLVEMLRKRTGSPLSLASLAQDLKVAPNTVRGYLDILVALHIVFVIRPFHANVARAIQKEPKIYFYDAGYVDGGEGSRLENTVALALCKHADYLREARGENVNIHYVRTKDNKEIDFAIVENDALKVLIEVKLADATPSSNLKYLCRKLEVPGYQLVQNLRQPESIDNIHIVKAADWLAKLEA